MTETEIEAGSTPTRSKLTAYLWWMTLFFGAHRFYVRKWVSALIYPVSIVVLVTFIEELTADQMDYFFMGYFAMLLLDACLIPLWVRRLNEWFAQDIRAHPNRYLIPDSPDIAPWARGHSKNDHAGIVRGAARVYFFYWLVPFLTGVAAAWLQSLELLIIPIVVLGAIGLISTLDRMLAHHPTVLEIPGVGPAIERVAEMRAHFWDNEPKIGSAVWGLFRHWKQFKPYWTLALIVGATIIIENVITYGSNNQFIELTDTLWIVGVTAVLAGTLILVNLVPISALSFHYSLSGKRTRLRFMTAGALIATILGYASSSILMARADGAGTNPSPISAWRLEKRMERDDFRDQLKVKTAMSLNYYINESFNLDMMNRDYHNLLAGLVPNDESLAFEIVQRDGWFAVLYHNGNATCNLDVWGEQDELLEVEPQIVPTYSLIAVTDEYTKAPGDIFFAWNTGLNEHFENPACHSLLDD